MIEKLNKIFEEFKGYYEGCFHNMLWQIIVNDVHANKIKAVFTAITGNGYKIGLSIANEPKYYDTGVFIKEPNYDKANIIMARLNKAMFDLDDEQVLNITMSSMFCK